MYNVQCKSKIYLFTRNIISHGGGYSNPRYTYFKANLLPDFETWLEGMMEAEHYEGDGDVRQRGVEGEGRQGQVPGGGVQAQGDEVMGEGKVEK